jgi:hypothetical protein
MFFIGDIANNSLNVVASSHAPLRDSNTPKTTTPRSGK